MTRIVIMGAPGSGKSTQAAILAKSLGIPHIDPELLVGPSDLADTAAGFVLDGSPRTQGQMEMLDASLSTQGARLDHVLFLTADVGIVLDRLAGGAGRERSEERVAAVRSRLAAYTQQTEPLARLYEERGLLRRVDASPLIGRVAGSIAQALALQPDLADTGR